MVCVHSDLSSNSILFLIVFCSLCDESLSHAQVLHPLCLFADENLHPSALQESLSTNVVDRRVSVLLSFFLLLILIYQFLYLV
jgi:hypothetical protein